MTKTQISWADFSKSAAPAPSPVAKAQAATPLKPAAQSVVPEGRSNNMFNMRNYSQNWLGEVSKGLGRGEMLGFKSPWHGFRAGARNVMRIFERLNSKNKKSTIRNFTPIFSPKNENDVDKHMKTISRMSGIGLDDEIDVNNKEKMVRLLTGLAYAESGDKALSGLNLKSVLDAIESAKTSQ